MEGSSGGLRAARRLADRTLSEILLMAHQLGRRGLRVLNARAVEDNVNLAETLGVADHETREWLRATRCHTAAPRRTGRRPSVPHTEMSVIRAVGPA